MEAGPGRWVQQGLAGSLVVLAGHFPPSEQAQHGLSQAASGEFDGREGMATTMTMRGLLWGRLEGDRGWKARLGQVWSLAMLAGHFPPPYCAQHGLPQAGEVDSGKGGVAAAKGRQLEYVWLEAGPGRRVKRGLARSPTVLVGRFPPPYRAQHGLPRAGKVRGGGRGQAAAKGGLQYGRLEGLPGPREKLGQAGSLARAVVAAAVVVGSREEESLW